jgi:hypothetical protein
MTQPNDPYQQSQGQGGYGYPAPPPNQGGYPVPPQQYGAAPVGYGGGPPSGHPVQLSIERAPTQSRVLAFFSIFFFLGRFIMLIPAVFVFNFVSIGLLFVAWFGQWAILFTGSYPEGMHRFASGALRWQARISAYLYGLTDKYPPFSTAP